MQILRRILIIFFISIFGFEITFSQKTASYSADSLPVSKRNWLDRVMESPVYQITHVAVPLTITGLVVKKRDDRFRSLRNNYIPRFNHHIDDYLQYAPAVAMYGLKIAGVEGRSSWRRMLVSDAFSYALSIGLVTSLKHTTKVLRPDGSSYTSFPSGHTATAFMAATMLHKEYGLTRSPWYSIGGYSVAMTTGIFRQLNNKHWVSDIMVGAAIGVFSTELGYFLADLIFKDKGIIRRNKQYRVYDSSIPPSFISLYLGFAFLLDVEQPKDGHHLEIAQGNIAALEGAWFWNRYFGVGARLGVTALEFRVDEKLMDETMDVMTLQVGPYFSYPISSHFLVGANLMLGYSVIPRYNDIYYPYSHREGLVWGVNGSFTYILTRNLGIRLHVGYNRLPSINSVERISNQTITIGSSVNLIF